MTQNKKFNQLRTDQVKIPRDTKAVETTVSQALKDGKVIADNGKAYNTIQKAENNANHWIRLPPETFNETLTVDTPGLEVVGSGYDTVIDGGNSEALLTHANNVSYKNFSMQNDRSSDTYITGSNGGNSGTVFSNLRVIDAGGGLLPAGSDTNTKFLNCTVENCKFGALYSRSKAIVNGCRVSGDKQGYNIGPDTILANSFAKDTGSVGMRTIGDDITMYGCRIHNSGAEGIVISNDRCVAVNNRVSDSSNSDIVDNGADTIVRNNIETSAN